MRQNEPGMRLAGPQANAPGGLVRHRDTGGSWPNPDMARCAPDAARHTPDARRRTAHARRARRQTPDGTRHTPDAGRHTPDGNRHTPDARRQTARHTPDGTRHTPDARRQTPDGTQPSRGGADPARPTPHASTSAHQHPAERTSGAAGRTPDPTHHAPNARCRWPDRRNPVRLDAARLGLARTLCACRMGDAGRFVRPGPAGPRGERVSVRPSGDRTAETDATRRNIRDIGDLGGVCCLDSQRKGLIPI